jgi:hypothetical protein
VLFASKLVTQFNEVVGLSVEEGRATMAEGKWSGRATWCAVSARTGEWR